MLLKIEDFIRKKKFEVSKSKLKIEVFMRNRNSHSITFKKKLNKCIGIFRAYNELQLKYGELLNENEEIIEIKVNVLLEDFELGDSFTSDFVCIKKDNSLMVRECVLRKNLLKPSTIKVLDASHNYWTNKGVNDWGIVLNV